MKSSRFVLHVGFLSLKTIVLQNLNRSSTESTFAAHKNLLFKTCFQKLLTKSLNYELSRCKHMDPTQWLMKKIVFFFFHTDPGAKFAKFLSFYS